MTRLDHRFVAPAVNGQEVVGKSLRGKERLWGGTLLAVCPALVVEGTKEERGGLSAAGTLVGDGRSVIVDPLRSIPYPISTRSSM